jgi:hypothetical protein
VKLEDRDLMDLLAISQPMQIIEHQDTDPTKPLSRGEILLLRRMMLFFVRWRLMGGLLLSMAISIGAIAAWFDELHTMFTGLFGKH